MKKIKKIIASVLCVAMCFGMTAFAAEDNNLATDGKDIYSQKLEESIEIDGINYTYKYYYNDEGNRTVAMTNNNTGQVDVIVNNEDTSEILVNDTVVATVSDVIENVDDDVPMTRAGTWKYIGTTTKKFSWKANVSVATAAAIIASVIPMVSGATVLAKMGTSLLSEFAKKSVSGSVKIETYQLVAGKVTNNKFVCTVVMNGKTCKSFTCYVTT